MTFEGDGAAVPLVPAVPAEPAGPALNPAQVETEHVLREPRAERPVHRADLREELRALLHDDLEEVAAWIEKPISMSKHQLSSVHSCEERFLHERAEPFTANAATVRGTVAHKAIELSVHAPGASPGRLVDRALNRLGDNDDWVGQWLTAADDLDRAELRSLACDRVAKFIECFPPLRSGWRPVTESRWLHDVHGGRIRLSGKVDLTIGGPDGLRAGKVVIDLKTGNRSPAHVEDLRFYALLETLRLGVPPWKIVTYYLDSGTAVTEVVTEGLLEAASRRVVAGVTKMAELEQGGRTPGRRPSALCSWCPLFEGCDEGKRARAQWEEFA